jgi:hypothetical protein
VQTLQLKSSASKILAMNCVNLPKMSGFKILPKKCILEPTRCKRGFALHRDPSRLRRLAGGSYTAFITNGGQPRAGPANSGKHEKAFMSG